MKKLCVLILMLLIMPGINIQATPPLPEQEITVILVNEQGEITSEDFILGHLDILILKSDANDRLLPSVSALFEETYGDPNLYDYLTLNEEYVSYTAFVRDASFDVDGINTYWFFRTYENEYQQFSSFKLIYVNENKQSQAISSVITIENVSDEQMIDGYIIFNIETGEWENYIEVRNQPNSNWIVILGLYFASIIAIRYYFYYLMSIFVVFLIAIGLTWYFKRKSLRL